MSEHCHCIHAVQKRACQHKGFCERIKELEDANKDKAQLLARCFAEKKELQKRNTELLTYCEKLDEHEATLQTRIEELEAGIRDHIDWADTDEHGQMLAEIKRLKEHYSLQVATIGDKDTYIRSLQATITELEAKIETLEAELAKHQGSTFHPDWSLLEATRDTVKEQQAKIEELENANSDKSHLLARCFAEKKKLEAALKENDDGN